MRIIKKSARKRSFFVASSLYMNYEHTNSILLTMVAFLLLLSSLLLK